MVIRQLLLIGVLFHSLVAAQQDVISVLSSRAVLSQFTTLISNHTNLVGIATAGNVTILAPTNDAFSAFFAAHTPSTNYSSWDQLEALLSYHVVRGVHTRGFVTTEPQFLRTYLTNSTYTNVTGGQNVEAVLDQNSVPVFKAAVNCIAHHLDNETDLVFSGGVIQVIDTVLTPPLDKLTTLSVAPFPQFLNLVSLASINTDYFKMMTNLSTFPDITSFIVDNFNATIAAMAAPTEDEVKKITNYNHIAGQVVYSPQLTNGTQFMTPLGVPFTVTTGKNGDIWFNDAKVLRPDVLVANGVLHVLDKWLNASNADARPSWQAVAGINASTPAPTTIAVSASVVTPSGLPLAAKIGIIVGVVVLASILIIGAAVIYHRRRVKIHEVREARLTGGLRSQQKVAELSARSEVRTSATPDIPELGRRSKYFYELDGQPVIAQLDGGIGRAI